MRLQFFCTITYYKKILNVGGNSVWHYPLMQSLDKIHAILKSGREQLTFDNNSLTFSLLDFWRWSVSDILSNATRGRFAEFIVATATNIDITIVREEWSEYDLITPDKIKLEIKSSAYLQSWAQKKLSAISFSTKAHRLDNITGKHNEMPKRHADVYVFCLLHHENKQTVNPFDLNQWSFYALATKDLNDYTRSQHSITLKSLQRLTHPVIYNELNNEIQRKYSLNLIDIGQEDNIASSKFD